MKLGCTEGEMAKSGRQSEFGRVAALLDRAEASAWARPGGPVKADLDRVSRLECALTSHGPMGEDWQWIARRLARAVEHGWHPGFLNPLVRLAGAA